MRLWHDVVLGGSTRRITFTQTITINFFMQSNKGNTIVLAEPFLWSHIHGWRHVMTPSSM